MYEIKSMTLLLSTSLGSTSRGWDNVLLSSPSSSPILSTGTIHSLLCSRGGVNSRHETLQDSIVIMDDLGQRSQAVCGAGGVRDNLQTGVVFLVIDSHHEHGSIC